MTNEQAKAIFLLEYCPELCNDYKVEGCCDNCEINVAIKALEKQEKIKEAFTHYAFNGYEMDVLKDYIHCLAEIKDILDGRVSRNDKM